MHRCSPRDYSYGKVELSCFLSDTLDASAEALSFAAGATCKSLSFFCSELAQECAYFWLHNDIPNRREIFISQPENPGFEFDVLLSIPPDVQLQPECPRSIKDSVVGEDRIVQYLLAVLNTRGTPLHWRHLIGRETEGLHHELDDKPEYNLKDLLPKRRKPPNKFDIYYIEDMVSEVQRTLCTTLSEFNGNLEGEGELEILIDQQFAALQTALKIPYKASEGCMMVSKKFLTLFRTGKLGPFILDDVPDTSDSAS